MITIIYRGSGDRSCKTGRSKGGSKQSVSAGTLTGRRGMAVIESFGGCCHGMSGGPQREGKSRINTVTELLSHRDLQK